MRTAMLAAMLATLPAAYAAESPDTELISIIETQQQQIEMLQQQLDAQRSALEALRQQVEQNVAATEEVNQKAEILAENIEEQPAVAQSATTLGGYGEVHVNLLEDQRSDAEKNEIDFHRFVLFFNHEFDDRLRFVSELELEHALSGDDQPGEVELEQAYIEYDWAQQHSLRAGRTMPRRARRPVTANRCSVATPSRRSWARVRWQPSTSAPTRRSVARWRSRP